MKIAYLVGGLPFGGIEKWLFDLAQAYRANGLVTPRVFNLSGTGQMLPEYRAAGIDVHCVGSHIRTIASHRLDTSLRLRAMLREFSPDIIHTVHFSANHLGRIAALGLGIPVITHLRNTKHEKRLHRRLSDKLLSYSTTLYLAVSKAVADVVATDHNLAGRPVKVLYNAIDASRFNVPPLDLHTAFGLGGPVVVAVGRYVRQKNFDLLIRAIRMVRDAGVPATLALVGEGGERSRLEALRDELGLHDHVALTGFRPDVAAFYKAADVFAMPSQFEGFLIAQLEAMYCGLPCVVSRHVPMLELAGEASLVCETEPADIADKLLAILRDAPLRQRLSDAARRLSAPHTMDRYAVALHGIYADLISGHPAGSTR
ncbi:glycosyltransferase [Nitratidesulfovibrio termitidis]|uniref:glycosyltransferase n=1 Tax=Nitratidesulfovibrio termitidis TaxID=42252 RepID=UPI00041039CC|nr:glycosyltransferase [Nitratidesulfovibrio termitidis]